MRKCDLHKLLSTKGLIDIILYYNYYSEKGLIHTLDIVRQATPDGNPSDSLLGGAPRTP